MLSVQTNLLAQNANRNLKVNTGKNAKITEKLSSGYKINRAADDASGLSVSEKMRRQVRGMHQSADNINEGVGYVQTAEGALNEVQDILQRINQLSVKAANGTNTPEDRAYIDQEIQQLKKEMSRIFSETTFNERKIWDHGPGEKLDYITEPAVYFMGSSTTVIPGTGSVTNANCGVIAMTNYTLHASTKGIYVDWTGYDGNDYKTEMIGWDDINVNDDVYSFEMSDFFGEPTEDNLLYTKGTPVIQKEISFMVNPISTREDIIKSINGSTMSASVGVSMSVDGNHSKNLTASTSPVCIVNPRLTYPATYASHVLCEEQGLSGGYDFNTSNDAFLVPSSMSGNMDVPKTDNDKYVFHFNMPGIGPVTATPDVSDSFYWSGDKEEDKEKLWWEYSGGYDEPGHIWNPKKNKDILLYRMNGTPASFKNAVKENSRTSILAESNKGNTHGGGTMQIRFNLTADKAFTYGKGSSSQSVGSFAVRISVSAAVTYQDVMDAIDKALNDKTVVDFNTINDDSATIGPLRGRASSVYIPIYPDDYVPYDDTQNFFVQAGTEAGQHISIEYECLSLEKLGMEDTNVLTQESAGNAIDEVKAALQIVSRQRSDFGAFQNRLEHAYNINKNVEENTQSSESVIRDTDIAEMMMEYSVNNILLQAGTSMLTQANHSKKSVLELLG